MGALAAAFDLVPGWLYAILVAVLLAVSGTSYVRMKNVQAAFSSYKEQVAEATRQAEADARAKERALQEEIGKVAKTAQARESIFNSRLATTVVVSRELRDQIAILNARPAAPDTATAACFGEARTARKLLGSCAERYTGVAKEADRLSDQVRGLLDYTTTIRR